MRNSTRAIIAAGLVLVGPQAGAGAPAVETRKLEGMGYAPARKIILGFGWTPLSAGCLVESPGTCGRFPELATCAGIDPGFCSMVFARRDRCLYVVTTGGEPGGEGADTRVKSVDFRQGPCSKS